MLSPLSISIVIAVSRRISPDVVHHRFPMVATLRLVLDLRWDNDHVIEDVVEMRQRVGQTTFPADLGQHQLWHALNVEAVDMQ